MFLVKKAIEKGATDWNLGLWCACYGERVGGQRELADFIPRSSEAMVEKGATNANILPSYFSYTLVFYYTTLVALLVAPLVRLMRTRDLAPLVA